MTEWQMHQFTGLDDLRNMSFIPHHTRHLQRRPVVLTTAVEQALEASRPIIKAHGHKLVVQCQDDRLAVAGEPVRLVRILTDLLSDCARCIESGGTISLTIERDRDQGVLSVSDSGVGISPEYLEDVFEMSSHVKVHQTPSAGGLGIDLGPVCSLAHMHGGSVSAYSRGIGAGSTLTVRLPAV